MKSICMDLPKKMSPTKQIINKLAFIISLFVDKFGIFIL